MSSTARTLLLRAVTRAGEGDRVAGWRDARRAVAAAPDDGLVLTAGARLLALLHDHRAALDASPACRPTWPRWSEACSNVAPSCACCCSRRWRVSMCC